MTNMDRIEPGQEEIAAADINRLADSANRRELVADEMSAGEQSPIDQFQEAGAGTADGVILLDVLVNRWWSNSATSPAVSPVAGQAGTYTDQDSPPVDLLEPGHTWYSTLSRDQTGDPSPDAVILNHWQIEEVV